MKTIDKLNDAELALLNDYMELYGLETLEEALEIALTEGSIDSDEGSQAVFMPENFKQIKLFTGHQKARDTKVNKALKKAKMDILFEDDNFYMGSELPKGEDGEFDLENCKTTCIGEAPTIIVLAVKYKAVRAAFDGTGQPEDSNFETTLADSIYPVGQKQMLCKYGNAYDIIKGLKAEYPDGEMGKTQSKVPDKLKVKFKVVLFCMIKTEDGWERGVFEATNRYDEKTSLVGEWDKRPKGMPTKFKNKLAVTGEDNFENQVIQIVLDGELSAKELKSVAPLSLEATRAVSKFIADQRQYIESSNDSSTTNTTVDNNVEDDDEDDVPNFNQ